MWFLTLLTFLCVSYHSEGYIDSSDKLQHLHILFRHGDRTPFVNFISNSSSAWPRGFGQLTDKGVLQEFQLGQWIRSEYGYFIPQSYNASDFHMRSTDIDRTLQSAQAVSAGIYQNGSTPLSNFSINWRPVPVHTVDQVEDILLSAAPCPCLQALRKAQFKTDAAVAFAHNHSKLFDMLSNRFGRKIIPQNIWMISDTLICMRAHDKPWPSWMTEELFNELIEVATYYWKLNFASTIPIIRFEIGVFLHNFIEHTRSIITGVASTQSKVAHLSTQHTMAYSAHDTDVTYLLAGFDVYKPSLEYIPYSAAIVLEIHGPEQTTSDIKDYSLRLRYKRGWKDRNGEYLQLPICANQPADSGCSLDLVIQQLEPLLLTEQRFKVECFLFVEKSFWLQPITMLLCLSILTLIVAGIAMFFYQKSDRYVRMPYSCATLSSTV